jgi:hypothetical protein
MNLVFPFLFYSFICFLSSSLWPWRRFALSHAGLLADKRLERGNRQCTQPTQSHAPLYRTVCPRPLPSVPRLSAPSPRKTGLRHEKHEQSTVPATSETTSARQLLRQDEKTVSWAAAVPGQADLFRSRTMTFAASHRRSSRHRQGDGH